MSKDFLLNIFNYFIIKSEIEEKTLYLIHACISNIESFKLEKALQIIDSKC